MTKGKWDSTGLVKYFKYELWTAVNGLTVLAGLKYDYWDGLKLKNALDKFAGVENKTNKKIIPQESEMYLTRYAQLYDLWTHSNHPELDRKFPPAYFIDWALSKGFRPDWLDWAIERGLFTPKQETEKQLQATPATTVKAKSVSVQIQQEDEILRVIREVLLLDPHALPDRHIGKKGVKAQAKILLGIPSTLFQSIGVFNKAWERLREKDLIKECN